MSQDKGFDQAPTEAASDAPGVVLDSHVVFDWLVFRDPRVQAVADAVRAGRLRWLATEAMLAEMQAVLARGGLGRWPADAQALDTDCRRWAALVPEPLPLDGELGRRLRCRDPDDQKFITLAWCAGARWLLSRDKAVLALARPMQRLGLAAAPQILTPEHWRRDWPALPQPPA